MKKQGQKTLRKSDRRKKIDNSNTILENKIHIKKNLNFNNLIKVVEKCVNEIPDFRQKSKIDYSLKDSLISTLAMMFFQNKSVLQFQRSLSKDFGKNNLNTMFKVKVTPSDTQLRTINDEVDYEFFREIFSKFFSLLQRNKYLEKFEFLYDHYLMAIDGTEYFSSYHIKCDYCLTRETTINEKKRTRYCHQMLQGSIVHPDSREVIPFFPEPIKNEDGKDKQDCELNSGKRFMQNLRKMHPKLKLILTADSLFPNQPFIEEAKKNKFHYLFVVKDKILKTLHEQIFQAENADSMKIIEFLDDNNILHTYRWVNGINLNANKKTVKTNYFDYIAFDQDKDEISYKNSWITDIIICDNNVRKLVLGGRAKWSIENENFNTLKKGGYNLEHNFGHGKKNLSVNFYILNLIAFYMHRIFRLSDKIFINTRKKFTSYIECWNRIRGYFNGFIFQDWYLLLDLIISPENYKVVAMNNVTTHTP